MSCLAEASEFLLAGLASTPTRRSHRLLVRGSLCASGRAEPEDDVAEEEPNEKLKPD